MLAALLERVTPGVPARAGRRGVGEGPLGHLAEVYVGDLRRKLGVERIRAIRGQGYLLED